MYPESGNGVTSRSGAGSAIHPRVRDEVIQFLREWLPEPAKRTYRAMIQANPEGWSRDPHFAGGIIPEHALRGNGITAEVLGVEDLDAIWPDLLRAAVNAEMSER